MTTTLAISLNVNGIETNSEITFSSYTTYYDVIVKSLETRNLPTKEGVEFDFKNFLVFIENDTLVDLLYTLEMTNMVSTTTKPFVRIMYIE